MEWPSACTCSSFSSRNVCSMPIMSSNTTNSSSRKGCPWWMGELWGEGWCNASSSQGEKSSTMSSSSLLPSPGASGLGLAKCEGSPAAASANGTAESSLTLGCFGWTPLHTLLRWQSALPMRVPEQGSLSLRGAEEAKPPHLWQMRTSEPECATIHTSKLCPFWSSRISFIQLQTPVHLEIT